MNPTEAREALSELDDRQRRLRTAYVAARYGWPETPAAEWGRHPDRFEPAEPSCRVTAILDALTHHAASPHPRGPRR
jgi:hypothetical protein